jgi:Domain of unknown function DUF11
MPFTITVTNTTAAAANITVNLAVDTNVVYSSAVLSQGTYSSWPRTQHSWSVGSLAPGATATCALKLFPLANTKPLPFTASWGTSSKLITLPPA